jgi:hypothetical protein
MEIFIFQNGWPKSGILKYLTGTLTILTDVPRCFPQSLGLAHRLVPSTSNSLPTVMQSYWGTSYRVVKKQILKAVGPRFVGTHITVASPTTEVRFSEKAMFRRLPGRSVMLPTHSLYLDSSVLPSHRLYFVISFIFLGKWLRAFAGNCRA